MTGRLTRIRAFVLIALAVVLVAAVGFWMSRGSREADGEPRGEAGAVAPRGIDAQSKTIVPSAPAPVQTKPATADPAASLSTDRTRILVVSSATLEPVGGAQVFVRKGEACTKLGATNAEGAFEVEATRVTSPSWLCVKAETYAVRRLPVSEAPIDAITVQLDPEFTIEGVVEFASGASVGAGVRVYAVPDGSTFSTLDPTLGFSDPSLSMVTTDESGAFELGGLDGETVYLVSAAGKGLVGLLGSEYRESGAVTRVRPSERASGLRVIVGVLYGAAVRFVNPDGSEATISEDLFTRKRIVDGPSSTFFPRLDATQLRLAGVARRFADLDRPGVEFFFYGLESDDITVPPIRVEWRHPGHEPKRFDVGLSPLNRGDLEYQDCVVVPLSAGLADVEVAFEGLSPAGLGGRRTLRDYLAKLAFVDEDGREAFFVPFTDLSESPRKLTGVPVGEYKIHLVPDHELVRVPPVGSGDGRVSVGVSGTSIQFDLSDLGGRIECVVSERNTFQVRTQMTELGIRSESTGARGLVYFGRPPFVFGLLPPGPYELFVKKRGGRGEVVRVPLMRGEHASCALYAD